MIDESLLKSNFIGRDGFRWWIGQIPPIESQGDQANGDGWGNRCKVRILGYHPYDESELSNNDLPWAQILLSTTDGSGGANYATNPKLRPGDIVFGFFLDGDNAQLPVIMGCFGRTDQVPSNEYSSPFVPFTGYTNRIDNDGARIKRNEENEQTDQTQKSPYHLPPQVANKINEKSYFSGIGDKIQLATTRPGSKIEKIATEIENAIKFVQDLKSFPNLALDWVNDKIDKLCDAVSKKIQGLVTEIIGGIVNDVYEKLIPVLNQGTKRVYDSVSRSVQAATSSVSAGHLAGVSAQQATIGPVKQLQSLIPCLIARLIELIGNLIKDMICSLLRNAINFVSCLVDQFMSGLLNGIIDSISSGMSAVLGGLGSLLGGFSLLGSIRQSAEGILGIALSLVCGENQENPQDSIQKWTIGSGPSQFLSSNINDILSLANTAKSIARSPSDIIGPLDFLSPNISNPNFRSQLSRCYAGPITSASPPFISIFGGGGSGAIALPVFGSITPNRTSSIIGAIVISGGSGYTSPPFVRINDPSGNGYGSVVRSVLDGDRVSSIIVSSSGENYPIGERPSIFEAGSGVIVGSQGLQIGNQDLLNILGQQVGIGDLFNLIEQQIDDKDLLNTIRQRVVDNQFFVDAGDEDSALSRELLNLIGDVGIEITTNNLVTIDRVIIENPGFNYEEGDTVVDNFGNQYDAVIVNGSIANITPPLNISEITDLPVLSIRTRTGTGARLKPIFGFKRRFQGEVKQVIDCVS